MAAEDDVTITARILALERTALDRWGKGDPGGYLEITAPVVSYFDPFQESRLDGLPALTVLYESIRGKVQIERDEIIAPRVQIIGDAAILTFRYVSQGSEGAMRWNCTEVYQRFEAGWRIIHSHWSFTKPGTHAESAGQ
jgi:hypothetical protein